MSNNLKYLKIKSVVVLDDYKLVVLFSNGIVKNVDFKNIIKEPFYEDLQDKILFNQVVVDTGGYGVSWNDDIDMSEYELWNIGGVKNGK